MVKGYIRKRSNKQVVCILKAISAVAVARMIPKRYQTDDYVLTWK